VTSIRFTGDAAADELLGRDPFALLAGMLLDQQMPMERAFAGPRRIADRLGADRLDPGTLVGLGEDGVAELLSRRPAIHRFPASMGRRLHALATVVVERYAGDAARVWTEAADGADLLARLRSLPGFGDQKAKIFVAVLGKRVGLDLPGWREVAGPYGQDGSHRSVADVVDSESLDQVRNYKQAQKRSRSATGPPQAS
jgi:uncharacterized HhH-GPD family protein